jgi:hypothetical protein
VGEHDDAFSFLGQVGAAFLVVRGDKPSAAGGGIKDHRKLNGAGA